MYGFVAVIWAGCGTPPPAVCEPPGTQVLEPRAAGCLVVHDGGLLMVQNAAGAWSIPGGYVENGETSAEAATRETLEEAGVRVTAGEPFCAVPRNGFVAHRCTTVGPASPRADGRETNAARFVPSSELDTLPLRFEAQRDTYRDVLRAR